ncbi:MAG: phosphoenolpyruvate synthase [Armatimonadota bacterium]
MDAIRWFRDLDKGSVNVAGGKGANLGELAKAGLPVPPGFVITAEAFRQFLRAGKADEEIRRRVETLDVNDPARLEEEAKELQQCILSMAIPDDIAAVIRECYRALGDEGGPFVAVRSSATAEDSPEHSFAGMNETFLNVRGEVELLDAVRRCYASLYGARVLFYRRTEGIPEERIAIAVIVQRMIDSEAAGVMFTVHPATQDRSVLVIEGAFGLGDAVVSGSVNPDHFEVHKETCEIISRAIADKEFRDIRTPDGKTVREELQPPRSTEPSLTDEQAGELCALGVRIEEHYGSPQDIEWALEGGRLYIVQSRAITALGKAAPAEAAPEGKELVRGMGASPGVASGVVRVLLRPEEAGKLAKGEILVTRMTAPDWVPVMKRAGAIVTDEGGMTSHAAIVSRELGIPCIVGTREGTKVLQTGQEVTVDARDGAVYAGKREAPQAPAPPPQAAAAPIITATRLYVNLAEPELAEEVAARDVDGVGLLRAEFIMQAVTGGAHPRLLMDRGKSDALRDKLAGELRRFARAFHPRPVIYRSLDFRSNEYRGMQGGDKYERQEANPMIGYRGCFRNVVEADLFGLELAAMKAVRGQGLANLHLMVPFVRTPGEFAQCKAIVDRSGLTAGRDFELWVMAEVPSIIYHLEAYAALGISGVSIGSNDLTQLMLGVDRDSEILAPLFDERDPAVLGAMRDIITTARRLGLTSSICGQAPSVYPELTDLLVRWGITSISVNPDVIERERRLIAQAEQRILLGQARERRERPRPPLPAEEPEWWEEEWKEAA